MQASESSEGSSSKGWERIVLAAGAIVAGGWFLFRAWMFWPLTVDDAYITMRHARNLVNGHGFVYNIGGPPVESYTNHLLFLLQALAIALRLDVVVYTKTVGVISGLATLAGAMFLARDLMRWRGINPPLATMAALTGAWLLADSPILATGAIAGLETALFTVLITWAVCLALRLMQQEGGMRLAALEGFFMGMATWTRPEGIAWVGGLVAATLFIAWRQRESRRHLFVAGGIALALWIALTVYRVVVFGHPQPNSYYVKMSGETLSRAMSGLQYLRDWAVLNWGGVLLTVAAAGLIVAPRAGTVPALIALLAVCGHLGVTVWEGGDWMPHLRLICPATGVLAGVFSAGLGALIARFAGRHGFITCVAAALIVCAAFHLGLQGELRRARGEVQVRVYGWADGHKALALWIAGWEKAREAEGKPPMTVAITDIGLVGYYSDVRVIDLAGLADPEWAQFAYTTGRIYDYPAGLLVLDRRPEIIVLVTQSAPGAPAIQMDWHTNRAVFENPDFARYYRHLTTFTHKDFPGDGYFLNVFVRKDVYTQAPAAVPPVARARGV